MERKGVNLLEGDDDEDREDEPERDSGDDGGSYERRRGGFVDVLMVILFVCVMLGGVAWAGYQFWWLPKMKKSAQLKRDRIKQEQQRKMRLAKMSGAPERAQQAPSASANFGQTKRAQEQNRNFGATARTMRPERPALSNPAEKPASPAAPMTRRNPDAPSSTENTPSASAAVMKKTTLPVQAGKAPLAAAPVVGKTAPPLRTKEMQGRTMTSPAQMPEKKVPPKKAEPRKQIARKKPTTKVRGDGRSARKPTRGFYYSVQVASCRTERCASSFSERLKSKGFSAFRVTSTSRARRRSAQFTEVRLGSFASLDEARVLASKARKNKIGARMYRSKSRWIVAAGSFKNLEDAALLLDRVEDSGFRGELASRLRSSGRGRLYTIRTGKFASLRDAMAFRKKIRSAGFSDAIVVRRRLKK